MGGDYNPITDAICAIVMDDDAKLENRERFIERAKGSCRNKGIDFERMPEDVRRLMADLGGILLSEGDDAITAENAAELLQEGYEAYKSGYTSTDMRVLAKQHHKFFREPMPIIFENGHFAISQNCLSYRLG